MMDEWKDCLSATDKPFDRGEIAIRFAAMTSRNQDLALARMDPPERLLLVACLVATEVPDAYWGPIAQGKRTKKTSVATES